MTFQIDKLQGVVANGFVLDQVEKLGVSLAGLLPAVAVDGEGHAIRASWAPVYGATRAELASATVRIGVAVVDEQLGDLPLVKDGAAYVVTIPGGKRIASLTLHGMKDAAGNPVSGSATLPTVPEEHRLVVRPQQGSQPGAPLHAVPSSPARGMLPRSLTGASFSNGVLSLPNVAAPKLRLSLVIRPYPDEFQEQPFTIERVSGVAAVFPTDLQLLDDKGVALWAFPGEYPPGKPPFPFDLRANFEPALNAALAANAGQPLVVTFRLKGKAPGKAGFAFDGARGALVRDFPATPIMSLVLEGDPMPLPIADRLADETPSSVTTDLTVTYSGIRVLEELSDTLPAAPVAGFVVGAEPVARAYPPQALTAVQPARVGLIGRVPSGECELAVQLVRMINGLPGPPLGPQGVLKLQAATSFRTHWAALPAGLDLSGGNVGVVARANSGRFLWASDGARPLVRLAVYDPDPGGRPLRLGGQPVHSVTTAEEEHTPARSFPAALFRALPPTFDSPLFLTVDLSDLALRYAR